MPGADATFSFVHAADLHLDTPFSGVQVDAPFVAAALRDASLSTLDTIVDVAIARGCAFVLLAGDLYDGPERGVRAQFRLAAALARLADAGIAAFIVHGNHDPLETGWSATGGLPANTTVFAPYAPGTPCAVVDVVRDGERIATVQGVSYRERATTDNLALCYSRPEGPGFHIGLLHCNVEGPGSDYANYSPCTVADLVATGLDYLALGHVHRRRIVAAGGVGPWIVYPGNTQARSMREPAAKGVYIVTVSHGVAAAPEFVACDHIRYRAEDVPIDGLATVEELAARLRALEDRLVAEEAPRSVVARARFVGRGDLADHLSRPEVRDDLLLGLRDPAPVSEPFVWWERLENASRGTIDVARIRERGDFAADVVAVSDELATAPDGELVEAILEGLSPAVRRAIEPLLAEGLPDVLAAATEIALDKIVEDP